MNNMDKYVQNMIPANQLKEGYDYEVVSFLVFDMEELEFHTADEYYQISTMEIIGNGNDGRTPMERIASYLEKKGIKKPFLQETDFYKGKSLAFYLLKDEIDVNLALSLGFGIVRMKRGRLKNQYLLYYAHSIDWDEEEDERLFCEVLMLKAYLQIRYPETFKDAVLRDMLEENPHYLLYSMCCNKWVYMDMLMEYNGLE